MNNSNQQNKSVQNGKKAIDERKEFGISSFSINNRISVLVLIGLIILFGVQSYLSIPKESSPDITIPTILVITTYPGVAPEDMETLITRPLEDELGDISDIKEMRSTTAQGYSNITLEFNADVNINEALQKVREKVDLAAPELPEEAEDPVIQEINLSEFPIMQVNVSGQYGMVKLKNIAEDLQDRIERIPSVLEVNLSGGREREVKVRVDLTRLKYYDLTFSDIITAIQEENVTVPGGSIEVGDKKFLMRVPGKYESVAPIEDIVVASPNNTPVYIRDLAEVTFGFKERETYAQLEDDPVITLSVIKRSGENIIATSNAVKDIVDEQLPLLPATTNIEITSDMSEDINAMVSSLENNIIAGLLLVVGVLLFFLGVRNASFVGIAVPMSMFLSFIIFSMLGMTMNMIVLFSLILALGMLVDNSIVIVENIYRYLEEGYSNFEAARKGTGEVAIPVISGTVTTLAAFFPLLFWPGIVGEFMFYLPLTLIITLSSSLFIALVVNPVLCALFMKVEGEEASGPEMTRKGKITVAAVAGFLLLIALFIDFVTWVMLIVAVALLWLLNHYVLIPIADWWQNKGIHRTLDRYENILEWSIHHGKTVLGIAGFVLFLSFVLFGMFNPGVEFFPEDIPPAQAYIQVEAPVGTKVEQTREIIDQLERKIPTLPHNEDIKTVLSTSGTAITANPMAGGGNTSNKGTIVLNFVDYQKREGTTFGAIQYIRSHFGNNVSGAEVSVEEPAMGPPTGKPINLEITGNSMDELNQIADEIIRKLQTNPVFARLDGLETDLPEARPEIRINVDRQKAALYGLSTLEIGRTIQAAINGVEASEYREGKEEYDITVRLQEQFRNDLSTLQNLVILDEDENPIPLSSVANWELSEGLGAIKHIDQDRVITVLADVRSNYNANAVLQQVQTVLQPYLQNQLPDGYTYSWTGQQQEQQEAADFLTMALLVALFLIAFILISQFNSLAKPFIVLTSVIMSTAGVLYGLVLFQQPFVIIMTGIGIIALAGVVVNNAIVLIDYIDILRTRDNMHLFEALIEAGKTRFRPVILTAITTVLGLIPLAIGFNLDFIVLISDPVEFFSNLGLYLYWGGEQAAWWGPMAIAVIVGLLFATLLTLILVPVLYYQFENGRRNVNRYMFGEANPDLITEHTGGNGKAQKQREPAGAS